MPNLIKFFITVIIIFSTFSSHSKDLNLPKNLIIYEKPKEYKDVAFKNTLEKDINLIDYDGKLVLMNFWATWCEPCKEEMPSLDNLQANPELDKIKIFAINIGKENLNKVNKFFIDLNIKNFEPYFDLPKTLAKMFSLRGIPTSILINKKGQEFARVIGSIDFEDKNFISWIKKYN